MQFRQIATPHGPVPARLRPGGPVGMVLATGAGTDQDHPGVAGLADRLAAAGIEVLTFDYAYRAAGRPFPDRPAVLLDVHRAAVASVRREGLESVVLAGRSMGGRIATMLAADGEPCDAVVAFGYPLHPAGRPDRLRVEHLPRLDVPALFITGTRDALARPELVDRHITPLPVATLRLIEGADHSFRTRGVDAGAMLDLLADRALTWLGSLPRLGESIDETR